ncbi:GNAT family N-acetyltransferase [Thorsellia anophelis]|uniref:Acetyltransferase (GNAT) domain-containing protein n=1 Tax=Thorsellia anophelis DSM 18579 TaxID=1123402 RepID=A0A1I0E1U8_9GAMM|nr:GNAT family N-acetyltransferase [Thorsellia anophelis]SET38149.1 Acetyltransferase (GNAT) domain-containing protein [Thorsellia anophelis DSM 18579]
MTHRIFKQLTIEDSENLASLISRSYAQNLALGIQFDASFMTHDDAREQILSHAVYGLFEEAKLIATVTIRFPWSNKPGPEALPHIGWFAVEETYKGQKIGLALLNCLETEILMKTLKAKEYTLGTASNHPWLVEYYKQFGFIELYIKDIGKPHKTLFMKKTLLTLTP